MDNTNMNSILNNWTDAQFYTSFTKEDIDKMSPSEIISKKMAIKQTFIDHLLNMDGHMSSLLSSQDIIFRGNAFVTGDYYPDKIIEGKSFSNR